MTVRLVPLEQLTPAPWNPRHIDKARLKNLAESIKADPNFLLRRPILAQQSGEIYAGNQRWHAAKLLFSQGWTPPWETQTVPADLDDVPDQLARERALRDNNAWGAWDDDSLARLLGDLRDAGSDTGLLGFDDRELSQLLTRISGPELNPDDADLTPPVDPITKPGDLWILGDHRLLCGDATNAEDVELLLGGERPSLMVTDPPYGVEYDPSIRSTAITLGKIANDDVADWRCAWELFRGDVIYSWHPPGATSIVHAEALLASGFELRRQLIWTKPYPTMGRHEYHWQHEPCWYAVRAGSDSGWIGDRTQTTVIMEPQPGDPYRRGEERFGHSTQKPLECMARPIRNHTGDVYDPFLGSGTTLIAAEQLGRRCYAMEIEPAYCDVIVRRWGRVSGRQAYKKNA
jgi:DNA modification methylase